MLERITEFAVQNLSIECCQLIQENPEEEGEYLAVQTSTIPSCVLQDERQECLIDSILPGIDALNAQTSPSHKIAFEENESEAGQKESVLLPIRSGSSDYGYLVVHHFAQSAPEGTETEEVTDLGITDEKLEYLQLFAKSVGPYIENCHIIANLESIVAQRTRELQSAQAQLMESTRLASVGEIAGMVAHEVLNPMTAVLARIRKLQGDEGGLGLIDFITGEWNTDLKDGGIENLLKGLKEIPEDGDMPLIEEDLLNLRDSVQELFGDMKFVEEQLHRIVGIVDNLRGLSRAQNKSQVVDVREAVEKTYELTHDGLAKRNIEMVREFNHQSAINCDLNELIQVIHNLVRNGMQAIEKKWDDSHHD